LDLGLVSDIQRYVIFLRSASEDKDGRLGMCPPSLLHGGEPKKNPGCVFSICFVLHVAGLNSPLIFYRILEICVDHVAVEMIGLFKLPNNTSQSQNAGKRETTYIYKNI
jgi:hypothetical protein